MENVVKFTPPLPGSDPLREYRRALRCVQLSLAANARTLTSSLAILGESLQKADSLICRIDDAEARAELRRTSESIHLELLTALAKVLDLTVVCQKGNA